MNLKKLIIIVSIIVVILLVVILSLNIYNRYQEDYTADEPTEDVVEVENTVQKVSVLNDYYSVKNIVNKYYGYLTTAQESDYLNIDEEVEASLAEEEEDRKSIIYTMLDDKYIEYKGITESNLFNIIEQKEEEIDVSINTMLVNQQDENMYVYIVYGSTRGKTTNEKEEFAMLVETDRLNRTFKVLLEDYIEDNIGQIQEGETLQFTAESSIENGGGYNVYDYNQISTENYITDMFSELKTNMMYDLETVYEGLNEEYRTAKFPEYQDFEEYQREKYINIVSATIQRYQANEFEGYTQYVLVDQNNKEYIINETSIMDFEIILDTYTIDLPQFLETYNNAEDENKITLNINKIFSAINDGDYNYFYSKLDDTFKQNNFPTLEEFEEYVKNHFYENNTLGTSSYSTENDLYIYALNISNSENELESMTKTFIMQLGEGTDFVMSFTVE